MHVYIRLESIFFLLPFKEHLSKLFLVVFTYVIYYTRLTNLK